MQLGRVVVASLALVFVAGCASQPPPTPLTVYVIVPPPPAVDPSPASPAPSSPPSAPPSPAPASTPTATPVPAPIATPPPAARLVFGKLHTNGSACYITDAGDTAGHTFSGGVVTVNVSVANRGKANSRTVWLEVEPTSFLLDPPSSWGRGNWNTGGPDDAKLIGDTVYIPGHVVKPGESFSWKVSLFFEEPSRVDYVVRVYEGPTWKDMQV